MGGYDLLVLPKLAPPAVTTPQHGRGLESMPTKLPGHKFLRQFDSPGSNIWQHARHGQHPKNMCNRKAHGHRSCAQASKQSLFPGFWKQEAAGRELRCQLCC